MNVEVPSPRRYRVSFECGAEHLGTLIDLLVKNVHTTPSMTPTTDGRFKLSLICLHDQNPEVVGLVNEFANRLVLCPEEVAVAAPLRTGPMKVQPHYVIPAHVQVARYEGPRTHVPGGKKASDTKAGRAILGVLKGKTVGHNPDFQDAFEAEGLSVNGVGNMLAKLVREGMVKRIGHGAYRLLTTQEEIEGIQRRQAGGAVGASSGPSE